MRLWTDLLNPADLTGFAREIAENYDRSALNILMPSTTVDDVVFSWDVDTRESLTAEYRAFDAETAIGDGGGLERKTAELAPLGRKVRFGEYERLRRRNADADSFQAAADKRAEALAKGVVDRINLLRGEALVNGGFTINEGGFKQTVDFGRDSDLTVTAGTLWGADGSDPFEDITAWVELFGEHAGVSPTHMLASSKTALALRAAITPVGAITKASLADVNEELGANELPQIAVINGRVGNQRIIPVDKLVMGVQGLTGGTVFGTTVEADDPRYSIEGELPGIVVGAYEEDDPATVWIRSAAIGLPILANPSMSLAATTVSA